MFNITILPDPWNIGYIDIKPIFWFFYVIVNFSGALLCLLDIYIIFRFKSKNSGEILNCGLLSGCALMSIPCAVQCLLDLAGQRNRFEYGNLACYLEAFFYVSSIMVQFFSICCIGIRNYIVVRYNKDISIFISKLIVCCIWIFAEIGTYFIGNLSFIYLMPAGNYCFYDFSSDVIVWWFIPNMLGALIIIITCYSRIVCLIRHHEKIYAIPSLEIQIATPPIIHFPIELDKTKMEHFKYNLEVPIDNKINIPSPPLSHKSSSPKSTKSLKSQHFTFTKGTQNSPPDHIIDTKIPIEIKESLEKKTPIQTPRTPKTSSIVIKRSLIHILCFFLGWGTAIVIIIYRELYGKILPVMDMTLGTLGSLHTLATGIIAAYFSEKWPRYWAKYACCRKRFKNLQHYSIVKRANRTTVIKIKSSH